VFALRAFVGGHLTAGVGGGAPTHPAIGRLLEGLRRHWTGGGLDQPPLAALCRMAGVSRVHLIRLCQREFGRPPVAAVRSLRLHEAAQLLATTAVEVREIAARCGFASPFHLSRAFRAAYGHPPTVWRARMRERGCAPVMPLVRVAGGPGR
jgi:AraC family transcriptional regulator